MIAQAAIMIAQAGLMPAIIAKVDAVQADAVRKLQLEDMALVHITMAIKLMKTASIAVVSQKNILVESATASIASMSLATTTNGEQSASQRHTAKNAAVMFLSIMKNAV